MDVNTIVTKKCVMTAPEAPFEAPDGTIHLRILQTTDLHAHVLPYDYLKARPARGGLAAAAARIASLRAEGVPTLLFDCGDFLQGTAMGDFPGQISQKTVPIIAAMNSVGYDAATLGNHDFSFGYDYLGRAVAQAQFPFVASNLNLPDGAPMELPHGLMLERSIDGQTIRIGVIGVAPPTTAHWESASVCSPMTFSGVVEAAREQAATLRDQGADIVVALCHSGILGREAQDPDNSATPLAEIADIDVVLAGHIHREFPGPGWPDDGAVDGAVGALHGKPTVMAGAFGRHVGVIDLALDKTPEGSWRPVVARARLEPVTEDVAKMPPEIATAHTAIQTAAKAPLGVLNAPLNSFLSIIGGDSVGTLIGAALIRHGRAAVRDEPDLPMIAIVPPYRYGWTGPGAYVDIPAGVMPARYSGLIYPYPNRLAVLRVNGRVLRLWLEQAVAQYAQVLPGATDGPILEGVGYALDMAYGLDYVVDLSKPGWSADHPKGQSGRIVSMTYQGADIPDDQECYVACSAFRAAGVAPILAPALAEVVLPQGRPIREMVMAEIAAGRGHPAPLGNMTFAPIAGASAIVLTSPEAETAVAQHHMSEHLTPLGPNSSGLMRLRLRF